MSYLHASVGTPNESEIKKMTAPKKPRVGDKGYSGNPNGRPSDKLKGLTPAELKQALNKLKRITPRAIDILIALLDAEAGEGGKATLSQGKVAKELITLFITLDNHTVKRAADMNKLLRELDRKEGESLDGADEAFEEETESKTPVFHLHVTKND
jgi:hypothetical protein